MIEDTVKIVNEAIKDSCQVNLIINNRTGGNALLIAEYKDGGHKRTRDVGTRDVVSEWTYLFLDPQA